jgi:ligand-binding sensor domain-containing protein
MDSRMMKLRELLRHKLTALVVIPLAVVAIAVAAWQSSGPSSSSQRVGRAFYSDDDGATWFTDSADKIMPFDHNGKPAVEAVVYAGADGKPFVVCLMRYSAVAVRAFEEARAKGQSRSTVSVSPFMEAKKPLSPSASWVPDTTGEFETLRTPAAPNGAPVHPVSPES